tara:strand:- start:3980 stop:4177 length:198 start_codon:yes stop_codon:yes gene_type:complete
MLKIKKTKNESPVIESVIDSLNVYEYDAIEINEKVMYVPAVVLEVIDSLHQRLEEAHTGHGIPNN